MQNAIPVLILAVLVPLLTACDSAPSPATPSPFTACHVTDAGGRRGIDAECATIEVQEDPARETGRRIELSVVRIPALTGAPGRSAFTLIQGGPGGSSIDLYLNAARAFEGVRRERDILLLDQRGTGRSNPLRCPMDSAYATLELELDADLARTEAQRCLQELNGDPRYYTTSIAVRDLELVRDRLGYPQLDVYGASYGTRVALHYLRRYPDRVRSLVLDGVVPADWVLGPTVARDAQHALDALFLRCRQDAACSERYGDLAARFGQLLDRVQAAPLSVDLRHPVTGERVQMAFGNTELALAVRLLSYQPETTTLLPLLIDQALEGDAEPFAAQVLIIMSSLQDAIAVGMHNAVVCSEDVPFAMPLAEAAPTYLSDVQMEVMRATCDVWPAGVVDEDLRLPFDSEVPALVLSGSVDPVTPPANGDMAAEHLSASRHIIGEGQGHGLVMRGCLPRLLRDFVEQADAAALDTSCVEDFTAPPVFLSFSGPAP